MMKAATLQLNKQMWIMNQNASKSSKCNGIFVPTFNVIMTHSPVCNCIRKVDNTTTFFLHKCCNHNQCIRQLQIDKNQRIITTDYDHFGFFLWFSFPLIVLLLCAPVFQFTFNKIRFGRDSDCPLCDVASLEHHSHQNRLLRNGRTLFF